MNIDHDIFGDDHAFANAWDNVEKSLERMNCTYDDVLIAEHQYNNRHEPARPNDEVWAAIEAFESQNNLA